MPPAADPALPQTIAALRASLERGGASLKGEAPELYARAAALLRALEGGVGRAGEVPGLAKELMRWSLEHQRAELSQRAAGLAGRTDPAAVAGKAALDAALGVVTEALKASRHGTPSRAAVKRLTERAREVEQRIALAAQAARHSTAGLPMRPVLKQPVSPSGVRLRPVRPRSAAADLAPFRVRSGVLAR